MTETMIETGQSSTSQDERMASLLGDIADYQRIIPAQIPAFVKDLLAKFPEDAEEIMACYDANATLATVDLKSLTGDEQYSAKVIMSAFVPGTDMRIVRLEDGSLAAVIHGLRRMRLGNVICC